MSDINVIVNDEIVNIDVIDEPVLVNVINSPGVPGAPGAPGVGVPVGGTTGQVLAKNSATNYDTEWVDVSGGAWGTITGTLSNQTDLQTALDGKFDDPTGTTSQYLRGDGSLATFPAIPSGTVTSVGLTMPSAFSVANSPITTSGTLAVTGAGTTAQYIRGDGSLDTFPSLTGYVPYTGATANVDLGTHRILAQNATIASSGSGDTVSLTHSSGSGIGLNITKGGNGEGLYINKTGGSGNAATIIGTINATTLVKSGGTSSQFLKADGSVDSSVYVPTSREITINGVTYDLSANRSWTVSGGISGSGAAGQVAYWTGTSAQSGSNNLFWDNANGRLGIGLNTPAQKLDILGTGNVLARLKSSTNSAYTSFNVINDVNSVFEFGMYGSTRTAFGAILSNSAYIYGSVDFAITSVQNLKFATGGLATERMRINPSGNVIIQAGGTFTDGGQRLQVQGTTLLNGNVTFSSATGMTWDATNSRLGIGTNAPAYRLDIAADAVNTGIRIRSNSGNAGVVDFFSTTTQVGAFLCTGATFSFGNYQSSQMSLESYSTGGVALRTSNSANAHIRFYAGNASAALSNEVGRFVSTNGNFMLQNGGTFTDSGERLQVTGDVKITGSGGAASLRVRNDQKILIGNASTSAAPSIYAFEGTTGQRSLRIGIQSAGSITPIPAFNINQENDFTYISGTGEFTTITANFLPTSGTGTLAYLSIKGTINQQGGANGITRGLYVNPTLTAAADFRAIETSAGGAYINTTAVNASAILQADSTTQGFLPPRMTTTQKNAISSPAAGLVVYDTTLNKLCVYTTAWETITSL